MSHPVIEFHFVQVQLSVDCMLRNLWTFTFFFQFGLVYCLLSFFDTFNCHFILLKCLFAPWVSHSFDEWSASSSEKKFVKKIMEINKWKKKREMVRGEKVATTSHNHENISVNHVAISKCLRPQDRRLFCSVSREKMNCVRDETTVTNITGYFFSGLLTIAIKLNQSDHYRYGFVTRSSHLIEFVRFWTF